MREWCLCTFSGSDTILTSTIPIWWPVEHNSSLVDSRPSLESKSKPKPLAPIPAGHKKKKLGELAEGANDSH